MENLTIFERNVLSLLDELIYDFENECGAAPAEIYIKYNSMYPASLSSNIRNVLEYKGINISHIGNVILEDDSFCNIELYHKTKTTVTKVALSCMAVR